LDTPLLSIEVSFPGSVGFWYPESFYAQEYPYPENPIPDP